MMTAEELGRRLHRDIPISAAMELRILSLSAERIVARAPLARNHNHAGTGFAGSLYSLASLTGWSLLLALADHHGLHPGLLLGRADIRYLRPATADMDAEAILETGERDRMISELGEGRGVRLTLKIPLSCAGRRVAVFQGQYHASPPRARP